MIHKAKKPYIYLGGGAIISGASAEVAEFAELIDAPVCDTLMGKGAFDGRSERYTGISVCTAPRLPIWASVSVTC